jgi:hypothetical protein
MLPNENTAQQKNMYGVTPAHLPILSELLLTTCGHYVYPNESMSDVKSSFGPSQNMHVGVVGYLAP